MSKKIKGLALSGASALIIIIAAIFGINLSSDKTDSPSSSSDVPVTTAAVPEKHDYHFRTEKLLNDHFNKHGIEFKVDFGYETAEEYEQGASNVINNPDALYKTEAEDGDGIYYIEETNEFVVLSTDGYIRTYFRPGGRKDYFDRQ